MTILLSQEFINVCRDNYKINLYKLKEIIDYYLDYFNINDLTILLKIDNNVINKATSKFNQIEIFINSNIQFPILLENNYNFYHECNNLLELIEYNFLHELCHSLQFNAYKRKYNDNFERQFKIDMQYCYDNINIFDLYAYHFADKHFKQYNTLAFKQLTNQLSKYLANYNIDKFKDYSIMYYLHDEEFYFKLIDAFNKTYIIIYTDYNKEFKHRNNNYKIYLTKKPISLNHFTKNYIIRSIKPYIQKNLNKKFKSIELEIRFFDYDNIEKLLDDIRLCYKFYT